MPKPLQILVCGGPSPVTCDLRHETACRLAMFFPLKRLVLEALDPRLLLKHAEVGEDNPAVAGVEVPQAGVPGGHGIGFDNHDHGQVLGR